MELFKILLIDSNVSIFENRKKRKITPPYSAGMRVCGQASTHGHPCDTGGICVQSGRFCTGIGHFFHIILCSFSYSETLRTGREGSLCTTLGYHKKFPPDSKGINEGKGQCNGIITPTFCKTKLNHHGHSFLFFL